MMIKKYEDDILGNIEIICKSNKKMYSHYLSLMWYIKSARAYKFWYYFFNIVSLTTPFMGTILTICFDQKWYSLISAIGALSVSLSSLFQCHEHWKHYRNISEKIKIVFSDYDENRIDEKEFYIKMKDIHIDDNNEWYEKIMKKKEKPKK